MADGNVKPLPTSNLLFSALRSVTQGSIVVIAPAPAPIKLLYGGNVDVLLAPDRLSSLIKIPIPLLNLFSLPEVPKTNVP